MLAQSNHIQETYPSKYGTYVRLPCHAVKQRIPINLMPTKNKVKEFPILGVQTVKMNLQL